MTPSTLTAPFWENPWAVAESLTQPLASDGQWCEVQPEKEGSLTGSLRRLDEIAAYPFNWDSYGSAPLSEPALTTALLALVFADENRLLPVPIVTPVSGGGVQLEWRVHHNVLELEVLPDGGIEYLLVLGEEEEEGSVPPRMPAVLDLQRLWKLLARS